MPLRCRKFLSTLRLLLLVVIIPVVPCHAYQKPSTSVFASPDDAGKALLTAAKSRDVNALMAIFGPNSRELILSGDPVQDKYTADSFVNEYGVMHRWRAMPDGSQTLLVGADNFQFPIPLKKDGDGSWFFDTDAGREEVLNRRIGRNELAIINACQAAAAGEADYFAHLHDGETVKQYASKFISDPGKQNGLYWKPVNGKPASPLGPLAAAASSDGYAAHATGHTAFHGYYFHMLKCQTEKAPGGAKDYAIEEKMTGGYAFVAYPAEYGNSGVMTFIINQDGVLLQKDLGKSTAEIASSMTEFDPDPDWTIVEP
jgi:Protein of unknown function (DUF2950)